jgi:hypothetical protein
MIELNTDELLDDEDDPLKVDNDDGDGEIYFLAIIVPLSAASYHVQHLELHLTTLN